MPSPQSVRYTSLDGLKGIFVLLMVKSHFYTLFPQSRFILPYHRFSFADTSQGFVFVSGIVLGLVLTKRRDRHGPGAIGEYIWARLWLIYKYHILMLLVAIVCIAATATLADSSLDVPWTESGLNFLLGGMLVYLPTYIGILPLYILLVAATPFVMTLLWSGRAMTVAGLSLVLWFAAPLSPIQLWRVAFTEALSTQGIHGNYVPLFNVLAWQAFYVAGLFIGMKLARRQFPLGFFRTRTGREIAVVAGVCATLTMVYKNLEYVPFDHLRSIFTGIDRMRPKGDATIHVMVGFASLAYLTAWLHLGAASSRFTPARAAGRIVRAVTGWAPFASVGRSAIECLAVHVIWYYAALTLIVALDLDTVWRGVFFLGGFGALFAIVALKGRHPKPPLAVAPGPA